MYQAIRVKVSEHFQDILLAYKLNIRFSEDGKYYMFANSVQQAEYDRQRRELRRENERVYKGMPRNSTSINRLRS